MRKQFTGVLLVLIAAATAPSSQTIDSKVFASGAFADPPNASLGTAQGTFEVDPVALTVTYSVASSGLMGVPTLGHVHVGALGVVGPVFLSLSPTGGGSYAGVANITAAQLTDFYDGLWYLNIHTTLFMISGEVRGQIVPPRRLHTRELSGANAVPPNASLGAGSAHLVYEPSTRTLDYEVRASGLLGTATTAHIHDAPVGSTGGVVEALAMTGPGSYGGTSAPLSDAQLTDLYTGGLYINVHSTAITAGEIRDQLTVGGLNTDTESLSMSRGGVQRLCSDFGPSFAGNVYIVLGSVSGTAPGTMIGGHLVELNMDAYFLYTLSAANVPPLIATLGVLDSTGEATSGFAFPPGALPGGLLGVTIQHSSVVVTGFPALIGQSSHPVPLTFLP